MLHKIIQFSVKNKLIIGVFILLWVGYGTYQVTQLPIDAVPDITNNQVQIITSAPALGAEDVERLITFPIEQAISNIPGLVESRSMSRFGLSLVTIVFDDKADVYWARQQVIERLTQVEIDANASTPQLAPVTTGLGEIYQYVLRPKKGLEEQFSLADLRTIQDWIVRRQLLGTKGVADVSTFGGELKQYEVSVIPSNLKALNVTIGDVFTALQRNNQNTGGAYIEKGPSVLYIRSVGLAGSIEDIGNIVVKGNANGTSVLISDVAQVQIGSAIRYGALSMAGVGELSGGIVMMLKGENSSEVIQSVKERIAEIQKTLPEGLVIEPFLDRTKMVDNAIGTVKTNLLEGALIVVLVLVFFLGNWRAGFIVASVIPLSMLFAITMMNIFGVSGNLMSLGALDFGLIVDGAVIIVEAILHHLHSSQKYTLTTRITQDNMDEEVVDSASTMMNAAVFGQVIILIVYLPILSLSGIEGKMFAPMAQTVGFAVIGAFILSITYVPMISSLFISKQLSHTPTFSDQIMSKLENGYQSLLLKAIAYKKVVVSLAIALFLVAVGLFSRMGGEFIPQLEEGDFATETRLLVGTNLSTTIDAFNRISSRLKNDYPEVEKIVSRIGSAEIPTDPMPIESGDMIIVLKDKKEWTSAKTFPELASKMAATAQQVLPGVTTGFQYPVQMRFNELMTGAKQDVVCKIFGEDLNQLSAYAEQLGSLAKTVDGTADWYIEKVIGMPQVVIDYNRREIAKYGLSVEEINTTVNAAFAGAAAGQIYEGEKKFDLVVRVDTSNRRNITDVQNLLISTPNGQQIPLYQLADVSEVEGLNQIQRENTRRRIIMGFNVRGRDVQSIVEELQQKVNATIKLESGYTITYGGAFENLQEAKSRLLLAVPVALLLIFAMLYFAFLSVRDGALIYTAIPLSAIGGVFALVARDMPFSISAGVGFIALFGVAVLNGIVLLSEFRRLQKEGKTTETQELVLQGTKNRLRPVLMTASVASLGFLPMALSNGAGAEVQRPLATVVIGGLVTATLLTLFVLPILYLLFEKKTLPVRNRLLSILVLVSLGISLSATGQEVEHPISLEKAFSIASTRNLTIKADQLEEKRNEKLQKSAFSIDKTVIDADYGKVSSIHNDTRFGITQSFSFPAVYSRQRKLLEANYALAQAKTQLSEQELRSQIRTSFYEYGVLLERQKLLQYADSIYQLFESRAQLRFDKGDANILEKTNAEAQRQAITNQMTLLQTDIAVVKQHFNWLLQDTISYVPLVKSTKISFATDGYSGNGSKNAWLDVLQRDVNASRARWQLEKAKALPDFSIGYNNQSLIGIQSVQGQERYFNSGYRFGYLSVGVAVPLFANKMYASQISAAKIEVERSELLLQEMDKKLATKMRIAQQEIAKAQQNVLFYEQQALKNANQIITTANQQLQAGDIDFFQWTLWTNQSIAVRKEYIDALAAYNASIIQLLTLQNL